MRHLTLGILLSITAFGAHAQDTTPPTLEIVHSWVEKINNIPHFQMLLDPKDETGFTPFSAIQFRSKLNSTAALPDNTPWQTYPWQAGEPLSVGFNCTSVVFEVRAVDAAGNVSPLQRRTFASPFPFSPAPNLDPKLGGIIPFAGSGMDCRGLFAARFDNEGYGDDVLQVDRASGVVTLRRQGTGGDFDVETLSFTPNTITDSAVADLNADGLPDIVLVVGGTVKVFTNGGPNGNDLQWTESTPGGLGTTGISTVQYCAVGDVTGEGKPDIIITGMHDNGMDAPFPRVCVLINNSQFNLSASNFADATNSLSAGRVALGDVDGDGWTDAVMLDPAAEGVVVFQNLQNGSFGSQDNADTNRRPRKIGTGFEFDNLPPQSLAVGDVTGDGRADAVVTLHFHGSVNQQDPNDTRNHVFWQLLDASGGGWLHANTMYPVSQGPQTQVAETYKSDVMLQDMNGDRFPELVFASPFEPGTGGAPDGGVRVARLTCRLSATNLLTSFTFTQSALSTGASGPHRLAAGRFSGNQKRDILVANGGSPQLQWVFNTYTPLSKPVDLAGGTSTDSDPGGTQAASGALSFEEYPGGKIAYSLTYVNNGTTPLNAVTVESAVPAEFTLLASDTGSSVTGTGAARFIRWTLDIAPGTSGVKNFQVQLTGGKAGATLAPKIALKQGTKSLVSATMPPVKIGAANFTAVPNSPLQLWDFSYKPTSAPTGAQAVVQASPDGTTWNPLAVGGMTLTPGTKPSFDIRTATIPNGSRYFRAVMTVPNGASKYSSVFNTFLPATTGFKVSTKSPPKSGQAWTFSATQPSTAANLTVRFQSTETPFNEGSWSDLPVYSAPVVKGTTWTSNTLNVPAGTRYFRAISAAPGWVDSVSSMIGPVTVTSTALILSPFSFYHIDFVDPAQNGRPATFYATTPGVSGLNVRFQSKLHSEDDNQWKDLHNGTYGLTGTKWSFKTNDMPVGYRDFRAISSAPGYLDNTTQVYTFEVLPPPLPQIPTFFGKFTAPTDGGIVKAGTLPVTLPIYDVNGVQRAYLEFASGTAAYKAIPGDMTAVSNSLNYTKDIQFSGSGTLFLRAVVVDGADPSATSYSPAIAVTVGKGDGTQPPFYGATGHVLTQSTAKARGSVKIKVKIGDDKQVYRSFLHRATSGGGYVSTVGQMIPAGASNPADFSCTDSSLPDGTYYYRVVAMDFDGTESISSTYGPFVIATPAPPPPPPQVDINIATSSRFVAPTVPAGQYNHKSMPYPDPSFIQFTYANLPTGKQTTFHMYRIKDANESPTFLDFRQAVWTASNLKASGSFKVPAPFWTRDDKNPFAGEGTYRIVVTLGGEELPAGNGVREFVVGHAWNLPSTFTTLDYGLYWFKDGKNALRCRENQDDEYFDRSKPTVIYVHGWQPGEVGVKRREGWMREDPKTGKNYDMVKIWKRFGYNVGLFNWNQFGNSGGADGLIYSQTNVYGGKVMAQIDLLPQGHSMIYALYGGYDSKKKEPIVNNFYEAPGSTSPIMGKGVCDLFFDELERCMKYYPRDHDAGREFRVIGHSLGTQVVGETMWKVLKNPSRGVPIPDRIALLEIAQSNIGTIIPPPNENLTVNQVQLANIQELIDNGVAIECYQSTDLQSLLGATLSFVGGIHDRSAYARVRPDHLKPWEVQHSHNDIPRWYMNSFDYNEFEAFHYWGPFLKRGSAGKALSASSPIGWLYTLMGSKFWYEQSEGKNTFEVKDDQFQLWDNRNQ